MDEELRAYLDQRFSSIDQQFSSINERFETLTAEVRGAYVLMENVQHNVEVVAEGVAGVSERLDRFIAEQTSTNKKLERRVLRLEAAR